MIRMIAGMLLGVWLLAGCGSSTPAEQEAMATSASGDLTPAQTSTNDAPTASAEDTTPAANTQATTPPPIDTPTSSTATADAPTSTAARITSENGAFSLTVPEGWQEVVTPSDESLEQPGLDELPEQIALIPTDHDPTSSLSERRQNHISVAVLPPRMMAGSLVFDLGDYAHEPALDNIAQSTSLRLEHFGYTVTDVLPVELAGTPGRVIHAQATEAAFESEPDTLHTEAFALLDDGRIIVVSSRMLPGQWDATVLETIYQTLAIRPERIATHASGFAFQIPDGWWQTEPVGPETIALVPASTLPQASILFQPAAGFITVTRESLEDGLDDSLPANLTAEDVLELLTMDLSAEPGGADIQFHAIEAVQIGDFSGAARRFTGPLPLTEAEAVGAGEIAVVVLDDSEVITVIAGAPSDQWDPADVAVVYDTFMLDAQR